MLFIILSRIISNLLRKLCVKLYSFPLRRIRRLPQLNSDYDTIIVGTSVSTTSQTINHYGDRKLSDYKFIVFAFGASDDDIRSIVTVPRVIFEKIGKSYSFVAHGSNDSTISAVSFTYASDTATTVKLSADHGVKYIRVFGIK